MKNILSHTKPRYKYESDIVETEISDWRSRTYLPRHIYAPETKSCKGGREELGKADYMPRSCRIESEKQNNANTAVNILKYQIGDRTYRQKHLENLRLNLERRLQVAKSQGNSQLLDLLQNEYKQLETIFC